MARSTGINVNIAPKCHFTTAYICLGEAEKITSPDQSKKTYVMSLISYVKKEEAQGQIAEMYKALEAKLNILPNVVQFHTASPELYPKLIGFLEHFFDHPNLGLTTIAYIRMLVSDREGGQYCVRFQTSILKYLGEKESDIEQTKTNYNNLKLDAKAKQLVLFVLDVIFSSEHEGIEERLNELKELGWSEPDIYEACMIAAFQKGVVPIIKAFQLEMDF